MWFKGIVLGSLVGLISIIYGVGGFGYGFGGFHGLHSLHSLTSVNVSALCLIKGGSCVASGTCATALSHFGSYYSSPIQGAACNTTFTCCLPSSAIVVHRFSFGGYGRRRHFGGRRRFSHGRRRGGHRRSYRRRSFW